MKRQFFTSADGSVTYVAFDGDMVDAIAHEYYGEHGRNTELIYEANPGLADLGPVLKAGVVLKLPKVTQKPEARSSRRLWD